MLCVILAYIACVSVIYLRNVLVRFKRYWSIIGGTGHFELLPTSVGRTMTEGVTLTYSLNISKGKIFADFVVLGVISENFSLEIFRPPYSLIHFRSICKSTKILFLAILLNLKNICPSKYLGYIV